MFSNNFWNSTTQIVAETCRMSLGELDALRRNKTAKLIAAIPAIAGCENADRTAAQHLITYILAERAESIFDHRETDDASFSSRLERISHFAGGDKKLIQRGINLLELSMICGYKNSVETDRAQGVYNPVVSGVWDTEAEKSRLVREVRSVASPEMDAIFDLEVALRGNWN